MPLHQPPNHHLSSDAVPDFLTLRLVFPSPSSHFFVAHLQLPQGGLPGPEAAFSVPVFYRPGYITNVCWVNDESKGGRWGQRTQDIMSIDSGVKSPWFDTAYCCVALGNLFNFSKLQFLHLIDG